MSARRRFCASTPPDEMSPLVVVVRPSQPCSDPFHPVVSDRRVRRSPLPIRAASGRVLAGGEGEVQLSRVAVAAP